MSRAHRWSVLATSLVLATSGTLAAVSTSASGAVARSTTPTTPVHIARDRTLTMDQNLTPGVRRLVVTSVRNSGFQIVQAHPGYSKSRFTRDAFRAFLKGRVPALKRLEANVTFLGGVASGPHAPGVMWVDLPTGRYWAFDSAPNRIDPAKILTLRVSGTENQGTAPSTATLRAIHMHTWAPRPATIGHRGNLTLRNDATENHFLVLAKLAKGKTIRDFAAWVRKVKHGSQAPPPIDFRHAVNTGIVSPGHEFTLRYSLPRGRYVMVCFFPDADHGGIPHALEGMFRGIRLT